MKNTTEQTITAATLALTLGAALSLAASPATAADKPAMEKCYGVALKGKNDCKAGAGTSCAGTSMSDYQANVWKAVPVGSCVTTPSPTSPTGHGQLMPFTPKAS